MPSEALISILTEALNKLVNLSGNAENTRIVPNLEVVDANPAGLTGYLIFRNDQDFNGPALKLPGITYTNGDLINVLFMRGTEPVAMQQGSGSGGSNAGAPADAQYLTLAVNAGLTNERVFTPNAPLTPTDGGAGGLYELDIDAATEIAAGVAPIATQAETNAGVNDTKFITPLKLETRLATVSGLVYQVYDSTLTNVVIEADATGNVVVNDSGADRDWRMASSINANALFLRGSDGALGLGTSNPLGIFHTVGDAVNINPNWTSYGYGAAPTVVGVRTRGTQGSPTAVQDGDSIWLWTGYGYETTTPALRLAASISFEVANPSGADVPCDIVYRTHASGDSAGSVTERMRLLSGGALMVGGTTQQTTGSKLELHRTGEVYLSLYNSGDTSAERGGYISWYTSGSNLGARIGAYRDSGNSTGASMVFLTQPVGGSLTARMYIDSTGRVGIGSLPSNGALEVIVAPSTSIPVPQVRAATAANHYGGLYATATTVTGIEHGAENDGTNWIARAAAAALNAFVSADGTIRFYSNTGLTVGNSFSPTERARILAGLMVGTTTDSGSGWVRVATGVSLNGTAYTNPDYALEHYFRGVIEEFKNNPGADQYKGLLPLPDLRAYLEKHLHLPNRWYSENVFEWADMGQLWCEMAFIYITELHQRLARLEAKHGDTNSDYTG